LNLKTKDLFEFIKLEEELTKILETKVDLVSKKALKPYIGKRILKEVVIV
jgi:predicted nucleotidyltransferase